MGEQGGACRMKVRVVVAACVALCAACGNGSADGGDDDGGSGGRGGAAGGRAGSAGASAGRGGRGGSGADADAGPAPEADAGGNGGTGGGGAPVVPEGCPVPSPLPAKPDQAIVIRSVHFGRSEVVLQNVSNTDQTIIGGRQGWQWCNVPGYFNIVLTDDNVTLAPGETYRFTLIERNGMTRPLFPGEDDADTNEIGIYTTTGAFNNSVLIVAFVSWGAGSGFETRESIGVMADEWTFGSRVTIDPGAGGFVATGNVKTGAGFTSVPSRCLPPP